MLKKYFICNSIHKKPPHFKGKLNWIQPPSDNHILISFFTHLEQELGSINTPSGKIEINLTLKEMTAFINLKNNQSINKQLQDHNTYKIHTHNLTNVVVHDTRSIIHYMHSQQIINMATLEFCSLPEIHAHLYSMDYQKYPNETALSALLFQDVMVHLTVSNPILPTSSSL